VSPRPDVSEERKSQILQAALSVFNRKGYTSARMEDIAREAGLSVGILYWYFKGKLEITLGLVKLFFEPDLLRLGEALSAPGTSRERILSLFLQSLEDEQEIGGVSLLNELHRLADREKRVRVLLLDYQTRYRAGLEAVIAQGVARGEMRPSLDPHDAAISFQIIFDGLLQNLPLLPKNTSLRGLLEQTFVMIFEGIQANS